MYSEAGEQALRAGIQDAWGNGLMTALTGWLDLGTGVLILWYGGYLVLQNEKDKSGASDPNMTVPLGFTSGLGFGLGLGSGRAGRRTPIRRHKRIPNQPLEPCEVGKLVTFQLYWNMMNSAYQSLQGLITSFTRAAAGAEKVFSLWDSIPDISDDEGRQDIDWEVESH